MTLPSPTPLVLLPGLDGTGDLFAPFAAALSADAGALVVPQVLRYPTHQPLDYAALADRVRAQLPTDRPYVLLGESFSGPLAVALAAERPPGLCGLVLCVSFARNPQPWLARWGGLLPWLPLNERVLGRLRWRTLGRFATPALHAALGQAVSQVAPAVLRARLRAVLAVDQRAAWAALQLPLLVLQANDDRVVPPAATALLCQLQPGAQVARFEAPHFLLLAEPAATAAVVSRFVSQAALLASNGKA